MEEILRRTCPESEPHSPQEAIWQIRCMQELPGLQVFQKHDQRPKGNAPCGSGLLIRHQRNSREQVLSAQEGSDPDCKYQLDRLEGSLRKLRFLYGAERYKGRSYPKCGTRLHHNKKEKKRGAKSEDERSAGSFRDSDGAGLAGVSAYQIARLGITETDGDETCGMFSSHHSKQFAELV